MTSPCQHGRLRRFARRAGTGLTMGAATHFALIGVARADVASEMNGFFNDAGGAALLGLSTGQSIAWATRTGAAKRLTVLDVRDPAHEPAFA